MAAAIAFSSCTNGAVWWKKGIGRNILLFYRIFKMIDLEDTGSLYLQLGKLGDLPLK
jgi:hypothetical protein